MNITYTGKRSQLRKTNRRFARQRGFFSMGIGLGLSALFVVFGSVLEPDQKTSGVNSPDVIQEMATISQSALVVSDAYPRQHQF